MPVIKDGDVIVYSREDMGAKSLSFDWGDGRKGAWTFVGTMAHIAGAKVREPELIVAGRDIPVEVCQSLVEAGTCAVYVAPAPVTPDPEPVPDVAKTAKGDKPADGSAK